MQSRAEEQREEAVNQARAAANAELDRALSESERQHDDVLAHMQAERDQARQEAIQAHAEADHARERLGAVQSSLDQAQAQLSEAQATSSDQANREAHAAYATQLAEQEARLSATREAQAAAEATFGRKQAELAEQHKAALVKVQANVERAEDELAALRDVVGDRIEQARQEGAREQATQLLDLEARAEERLRQLPGKTRRED